VSQAFEDYFVGQRNVVYERARFGMKIQEPGESIDDFATALHILSEYCDYGTLRESLVRDRIVLGVSDPKLRERLMLSKGLTLAKAVEIAKHWESVKKQQETIQGESGMNVEAVGQRKYFDKKERPRGNESFEQRQCKFCGFQHAPRKCPAYGEDCRSCGKRNHFASQCRNRKKTNTQDKVNEIDQKTEEYEVESLERSIGRMEKGNSRAEMWKATVLLDDKPVLFKMDSGADVTAVPYYTFKKLWRDRKIASTDTVLSGPDGKRLNVVGAAKCTLKNGKIVIKEEIFIVKGLQRPLLGLGWENLIYRIR
jgi:hypothetical protein